QMNFGAVDLELHTEPFLSKAREIQSKKFGRANFTADFGRSSRRESSPAAWRLSATAGRFQCFPEQPDATRKPRSGQRQFCDSEFSAPQFSCGSSLACREPAGNKRSLSVERALPQASGTRF